MDEDASGTIEVAVEAPGWALAVTDPEGACRRAAEAALALLPETLRARAEIAVLLADDARVRDLNRDWRGKDAPTNVLSFPNLDGLDDLPGAVPVVLGDVVLALETVCREAGEQGKPAAAHLSHLVVHGVLHLLGHDHAGDDEAEAMEALERRLVGGLGYPDPYAPPEALPEGEAA
ncbi:MAG: rRNA maturation RNase YbeY [Geminicoccaceae bacterium]|nr:rRNA maturation RNase YbeY [Geminicoccaceae bacterium]